MISLLVSISVVVLVAILFALGIFVGSKRQTNPLVLANSTENPLKNKIFLTRRDCDKTKI